MKWSHYDTDIVCIVVTDKMTLAYHKLLITL